MIISASPIQKIMSGPNDSKVIGNSASIHFGFPLNSVSGFLLGTDGTKPVTIGEVLYILKAWAPELHEALQDSKLKFNIKFSNDVFTMNPEIDFLENPAGAIASIDIVPGQTALYLEDHPMHIALNKLGDLSGQLNSNPDSALAIMKSLIDNSKRSEYISRNAAAAPIFFKRPSLTDEVLSSFPKGVDFKSAKPVDFNEVTSKAAETEFEKWAALHKGQSYINPDELKKKTAKPAASAAPASSAFSSWAKSFEPEDKPVEKKSPEEVVINSFDDWAKKFM